VPSALEAIRHAAIVLSAVFPFGGGFYRTTLVCAQWRKATDFNVPAGELLYGNMVTYTCPACSFSNSQTVLP
jgi:hypothetical protein